MINKHGFTLIELIVAMAIGLVIIAAIYSASQMGQRSSVSIGQKVVTQQDTRAVLDLMAMEIRMASYNPTISSTIWNTIPTAACVSMGNITPVAGKKGIQIANANTILIAMDLDGNGSIGNVSTEYIMYSYNTTDQTITRNVNCGGNVAILGGTTSATAIANNATTPTVKLFTYWGPNIDNAALPDIDITSNVITDPVRWIPQIRRVIITIVADTELMDAMIKNKRRMTYSTSVIVRNHVLSPPIPN